MARTPKTKAPATPAPAPQVTTAVSRAPSLAMGQTPAPSGTSPGTPSAQVIEAPFIEADNTFNTI